MYEHSHVSGLAAMLVREFWKTTRSYTALGSESKLTKILHIVPFFLELRKKSQAKDEPGKQNFIPRNIYKMDFSLEAFTVSIIFQRNTARKGQEGNK